MNTGKGEKEGEANHKRLLTLENKQRVAGGEGVWGDRVTG